MRTILQRVSHASVTVDDQVIGAIEHGLMVLAAVRIGDNAADAEWMAGKIAGLRIFPDEQGRMNRSVVDVGGKVLLVPQFTLYGDARKGRRPSFVESASRDSAIPVLEETGNVAVWKTIIDRESQPPPLGIVTDSAFWRNI